MMPFSLLLNDMTPFPVNNIGYACTRDLAQAIRCVEKLLAATPEI
jgi:hypothetical protein